MQDFNYDGTVKLQKELKQQPLILILESNKDFDCAAVWKWAGLPGKQIEKVGVGGVKWTIFAYVRFQSKEK